jgi:hypothetical protein
MPVVNVHRYFAGTVDVSHEQTVSTLVFGGLTNVVLDATAFTAPGTYSIFKYTPTTGFPGGQAELNANVTFSMSGPGLTVSPSTVHGFNDTSNSRVTVTLI